MEIQSKFFNDDEFYFGISDADPDVIDDIEKYMKYQGKCQLQMCRIIELRLQYKFSGIQDLEVEFDSETKMVNISFADTGISKDEVTKYLDEIRSNFQNPQKPISQ